MNSKEKKEYITRQLELGVPVIIYENADVGGAPRELYKKSYNEIAADLELFLWKSRYTISPNDEICQEETRKPETESEN
jgi:hypothetical protein